ncbi:hypothetical protein LCGC14_1415700 [marine sediment metagenome]|uniref:Uncharacterized protein n=1 Tax=marine sediment metagenome TaxID=412755 RepID=A0A0F9MUM2_9ZZZZ
MLEITIVLMVVYIIVKFTEKMVEAMIAYLNYQNEHLVETRIPNAKTIAAMEETDAGVNLHRFNTIEEMIHELETIKPQVVE